MNLKEIPPLTRLVDDGIQREIHDEFQRWNKRDHIERYPLSPSGIGKCALKLARDVAHYHGLSDYPRSPENRTAKLQRVFSRGHLLEEALVGDIEKYTSFKMRLRQQRVLLFNVQSDIRKFPSGDVGYSSQPIEGDVDGMAVCSKSGTRLLVDFKSKGAYYSAGFSDSIGEFFEELVETQLVEDLGHNCYFIKDVKALFDVLPMDDFFVDYLLQLNSYAFSDWFQRQKLDGVALYYENKNTCANYEVRWVPDRRLFDFAKKKFEYIYATVMERGAEAVEREFNVGSNRCRLCEYNELCNGKQEFKQTKKVGDIDKELELQYKETLFVKKKMEKIEEIILREMEKKGLTHFSTRDGLTYERKFLKSPKPHYELRLVK